MKALPLWQPWASLVAMGAKRIETRPLPPSNWRYGLERGQRIAIHATKTAAHLWICDEWPFHEHISDPAGLPLGALIATATLQRGIQITPGWARELERVNPQEHAFGSYQPGRWAWVLTDVVPLLEPVPFRGSQGTFDVPDDLGVALDHLARNGRVAASAAQERLL